MAVEIKGIKKRAAGFWKNTAGSVMAYAGVMLPVLLGVSGLSVDVSMWYIDKRVAQSAADGGALGGALSLHRMGDKTNLTSAATEGASENGYNAGIGDLITINNPPKSGPYTGSANAVEVIVRRTVSTFFSRLLHGDSATIVGRAVAVAGSGNTCIWALDPTASQAVKVSGGAVVNMSCGVYSNSNDPDAVDQSGGGCLTASEVRMVGGASGGCINPTPEQINPSTDPFASLAPPPYGPCGVPGNINVGSGQTLPLSPDVYCGKITVSSGGTLNLSPGTYVFDGASLTVHGALNGTDVSFYLTENTGQSDNITINSGAVVDLSAPTNTGTLMDGILIYQDRNAPDGINHNFTGQAQMVLNGIIYTPNADLKFAGGSSSQQNVAAIVAKTVTFTGDSDFADISGAPAVSSPLLTEVGLVE